MNKSSAIFTFTILLFFFQCSDPAVVPVDGVAGLNGLVNVEVEPPGVSCASGGTRISVGLDTNKNGSLDTSEIEGVSLVCNGNDGNSSPILVTDTVEEAPGDNCETGGTKVVIGLDLNENTMLEEAEVLSSFFICQGADGDVGAEGLATLLRASTEETGVNCENGGLKVEVGIDHNRNLMLEDDEVESSYFVCNGENGSDGISALSEVTSEPEGANCANGGLKISLGLDLNSNGSLENEEVLSENFLCNGLDGIDGENGLTNLIRVVSEDPGENCENGGLRIDIGLDDNRNENLEDGEIGYTYFTCNGLNGASGFNTLLSAVTEESGINCQSGGIKITLGLDTDRNGTIEESEEIGVYFICNGDNGVDGADGRTVLLLTAPAGSACGNGGTTFTFGYDGNGDADLSDDEDEIIETTTICNGVDGTDGKNTIINTNTENPGANCANGGLSIQVGIDTNDNNTIDTGEEIGVYYVCNGADGRGSLISTSTFVGNQNGCPNGGIIILTGSDDNSNGLLDSPSEVDATAYVCNGDDGTSGSSDEIFEFYFSEGFDGYSGVRDASITDKNPTELGDTFSVDRLSTNSHGLVYFPGIDKLHETMGTTQFEIVEAILYLRGVSTPVVGSDEDNWIGVKVLRENAPLFVETEVSWLDANSSEVWSSQGANVTEDQGAYDFSDMFRLPQGIQFQGYIPLLLNRREVASWTQDASNNKGLVLTMVDQGTAPYELDLFSSNYNLNEDYRPLLYLKTKIITTNGRDKDEKDFAKVWDDFSYDEKLAPLKEIRRYQGLQRD